MCGKARSAKPREDNIFISKCISWKNLLLQKVNLVWKVITAHNISRISLIFFNRKKKSNTWLHVKISISKALALLASQRRRSVAEEADMVESEVSATSTSSQSSQGQRTERDKASFKRLAPRDSSLSSFWALCNYVPEGIHRTDLKDQDTLICYI